MPSWEATGPVAVGTGWAEMCDYCGCRGVPAIADLMAEHAALVDQAGHVREALRSEDLAAAMSGLTSLVRGWTGHVRREEDGIFAALRSTGSTPRRSTRSRASTGTSRRRSLGSTSALRSSGGAFTRLLDDLDVHVQREELGIFPVSVVTLGAAGWAVIDEAHARTPSFLLDPDAASPDPAPVDSHEQSHPAPPTTTRTPCRKSH